MKPIYAALTLACLSATVFLPSPAHAEPPAAKAQEEGRTHFTRGVALFKDADFRAALIEFKKAYEIAPSFKVQYNIGQTCLELQDYSCALSAFQKYLAEGQKDVPAARRKEVEKEVTRLASLIAHVRVAVNKEGAEISVDDVVIGKSPLKEPLVVGAGRHKFSATLSPLLPATKVVDVASGDTLDVALELAEPNVVAPTPVVVAPPPEPSRPPATLTPAPERVEQPSRAPFYIGVVSTVALAAGAGVLGGLSLGAKGSLDDKAGQLGITPQEMESARSDVKTLTLATDIVAGVAIVAGVVTTVLYFTTSPKAEAKRANAAPVWLTGRLAF
jgi:hypothetical protein